MSSKNPKKVNMSSNSRLLLFSNSTMAGTKYMSWTRPLIVDFLKTSNVKEILFIPFAGVSLSWDRYTDMVREALPDFKVCSIHHATNAQEAVKEAKAIMIGGGNTFHLLTKLYEFKLLDVIRDQVNNKQVPYIGWSAGSNVAGPDIGTTNDMPIIFPPTDKALNLISYNLNPHYNEWAPPNFKGETRIDRLNECVLIKRRPIVAISEGVGILVENGKHTFVAPKLPEEFLKLQPDERKARVWNYKNSAAEIVDLPFTAELAAELKRIQEN